MKNITYLNNINEIGGVETFIWELSKKYDDYDITLYYRTGSPEQIKRIKKYIRVKEYHGEKLKCDKLFIHYDVDILDNVEAKEIIRIVHYLSKTQKCTIKPFIHPKVTKHIAVSQKAADEWEELTGIKCEVFRNPLTITEEEKKPALWLISATRLTYEKGKERIIKLGQLLDKAGVNYIWLIFTDDTKAIDNPNIVYMKPRLNIRPYLASVKGKGYGVQLSSSEGDCYLTRECEGLGLPLLVTPLDSFKEQGLIEGKNCYYLPFDMVNIDIDKIVNNIPVYEPYIAEDRYDEILEPGESKYKEELKMKYLVKATNKYKELEVPDLALGRTPEEGEEFEVNYERLQVLLGENDYKEKFVEVVKEIKEDAPMQEEIKQDVKTEENASKKKKTPKKK